VTPVIHKQETFGNIFSGNYSVKVQFLIKFFKSNHLGNYSWYSRGYIHQVIPGVLSTPPTSRIISSNPSIQVIVNLEVFNCDLIYSKLIAKSTERSV